MKNPNLPFSYRTFMYIGFAIALALAVLSYYQDRLLMEQYENIEWLLEQLHVTKLV